MKSLMTEDYRIEAYEQESGALETKYGLPEKIRFCKRCVISNQRPNSAVEFSHTQASKKETICFDENGVCDACRYAEKKRRIDWKEREAALKDLCNRYRKSDGSFDCIVPGSGGKDSFYAAHILKTKYHMHPLTVTWAPHIYTDWGWKNFQKWIHAGVDNYLCTPNGKIHRLLTRLALETLFHPFQPFIFGQKSIAPRMALMYDIPLIFYGENEAEYGNPIQSAETALQQQQYFSASSKQDIHIAGVSLHDLKKTYRITENDLSFYMPVDPETIEKKNIQVHYMGYYLRWHPQKCYYYAVENGDFEASPERTPGTYSKYNSIDDKMDDLHYYTTYIKFGIGRATYDASQEIRSGDITREEGIALCKKYDGEFPERFIDGLFAYLSVDKTVYADVADRFDQPIMDRAYFDGLADRFRSPHLWRYADGTWHLRNKVWDKAWTGDASHDDEAVSWNGNRF